MGVYRVNDQELKKAVGILNHIYSQLERCYGDLNVTYRSIQKQNGLGIQGVKNTINTQKENLRIQKQSIAEIRDCVQSIIDKTAEASGNAQKILETVDLSKTMKDAVIAGTGVEVSVVARAANVVLGHSGDNNIAPYNDGSYIVPNGYDAYLMNQWNYSKFTDATYGNSGCGIVSLAMARSIIDQKSYNPETDLTWIDGVGVSWSPFHSYRGVSNQNRLAMAYEELMMGHPSVIRVGSAYHYVAIVGVRDGVDPNNLAWSDFLIADPGDGKIKEASAYSLDPNGGQIVTATAH